MNKNNNIKRTAILIVEDEVESQKYFELILRKKFNVDFCDSRKSMNDLLAKNVYDVVIMDISLKDGSNGVDLIKEIRSSKTKTHLPIVCLSAHVYGENKNEAKQAGADIYLAKPVRHQVLLSTLEELLITNTNQKK